MVIRFNWAKDYEYIYKHGMPLSAWNNIRIVYVIKNMTKQYLYSYSFNFVYVITPTIYIIIPYNKTWHLFLKVLLFLKVAMFYKATIIIKTAATLINLW